MRIFDGGHLAAPKFWSFEPTSIHVCWWAHVFNAEVLQRPGLSTIGDILRHRHLSLFGHVAWLDPGVPAHAALRLM